MKSGCVLRIKDTGSHGDEVVRGFASGYRKHSVRLCLYRSATLQCTYPGRDRPCALLQMTVATGEGRSFSLATDEDWKVAAGPIAENDVWNGEVYDARREKSGWDRPGYDDLDWDDALSVEGPGGRLDAQLMPPIKVTRTLRPVRMTEPREGVYVFDFGQVRTGWQKVGCALHMEAIIPPNTTAEIWVPRLGREEVTVNVNGRIVWADGSFQEGAPGIISAAQKDDYVKLEAGSGSYCVVVE